MPLPGNQPEEPGTDVQPMGDGRVLIRRLVAGRHTFSLLYPTGPDTGELPLGAVECRDEGTRLRLLPPAPGGEQGVRPRRGPALDARCGWWRGAPAGPSTSPRSRGGARAGCGWTGRDGCWHWTGRSAGGPRRSPWTWHARGEVSPLLQIAADSDDRLLLADADSGLLLIRSDAPSPGRERLGWGVLGSMLPVRFPECLRADGCTVTPFAIQPGQVLTPEGCAVALRIDGPLGSWIGVWRPATRRVHHLPAPEGWLAGAGRWSEDGVLHLPYATAEAPCAVARVAAPSGEAGDPGDGAPAARAASGSAPPGSDEPSEPDPRAPAAPRPVPLQQAPLGPVRRIRPEESQDT